MCSSDLVKGELLHHLRDTGFALRISHRLRELWMKARRPLALGCSDQQIADQLGADWLHVVIERGSQEGEDPSGGPRTVAVTPHGPGVAERFAEWTP